MSTKNSDLTNNSFAQQYTKWVKLFAILGFISSGFMILAGLVLLIFIVGAIYIAIGGISLYLNVLLWRSATVLSSDEGNNQPNQTNIIKSYDYLTKYFKIQVIITLVTAVLSILTIIFSFGALMTSFSTIQRDFNVRSIESNN